MKILKKHSQHLFYFFILFLILTSPLYSQNVGIGTDNPQEKLHVYDGDLLIQNSIPYLILSDTTPTNGKAGIRFRYSTTNLASIIYDIYNSYFQFSTYYNGTRPDLIINGSGNIGLGTKNPQEKLHVYDGDLLIQNSIPYLILSDTTPTNGKAGIKFRYSTTNLASIIYDIYNSYFQFSTHYSGTRPDLIIDGSGRIGLGTLNPGTRLHINQGDITVDNDSPLAIFNANTANTGIAGLSFKNAGVAKGWINYNMSSEHIKLSTEVSGTRNDLIVNSIGDVGIGTDNPLGELHILGDTVADLYLTPNAAGSSYDAQIILSEDDDNTFGMRIRYDGDANQLRIFGKNGGVISGPHLNINRDNGNVGIGITAPTERLSVAGNIQATGTISAVGNINSGGDIFLNSSTPYIYLDASGTNLSCGLGFREQGNSVAWMYYDQLSNYLAFSASTGGGNNMVINNSGYVGIGTSIPVTTLHVSHPSGTTNGLTIQNDIDSDKWHFYVYTTNNLSLYYNGILKGTFDDVTGNYTASSDRRLKKNIDQVEPILDNIMDLTPHRYHFLAQDNSDQKHIGFIAQEVRELFPSLVHYQDESDLYTIDYSGFGVLAIKAIQEQQEVITQQQEEIQNLTAAVRELMTRMEAVENN